MPQKKIKPVFIIGSPRSGTSVLTWAIGQHPNIKQTPETVWIVSLLSGAFLSYVKGSERGRFSHLSNVDYSLSRFFERVGESIDTVVDDAFSERCKLLYGETGYASRNPKNYEIKRSQDEPKSRWVDGTPLNTHYIWAL
ncbi:MAG: sulfotransferase, partial [Candidatus Azotimanducaceae bacterium]